MALIEWTSNFSVHLSEFDEEHKQLVAMINSLHEAMKSGKGKDSMAALLDKATVYAQKHFAHEEKMMLQYNYPKYKEHKEIHDEFAQKVTELRGLHDQNLLQANQLLNILREWLINHICNTDMHYSSFFLKAMKEEK
ncbi:MAG: bacteriohemerythrin [Sporomusaceae bacterium]|nr:bacteriohemerythrin [Sporomusaceae bacterium]